MSTLKQLVPDRCVTTGVIDPKTCHFEISCPDCWKGKKVQHDYSKVADGYGRWNIVLGLIVCAAVLSGIGALVGLLVGPTLAITPNLNGTKAGAAVGAAVGAVVGLPLGMWGYCNWIWELQIMLYFLYIFEDEDHLGAQVSQIKFTIEYLHFLQCYNLNKSNWQEFRDGWVLLRELATEARNNVLRTTLQNILWIDDHGIPDPKKTRVPRRAWSHVDQSNRSPSENRDTGNVLLPLRPTRRRHQCVKVGWNRNQEKEVLGFSKKS